MYFSRRQWFQLFFSATFSVAIVLLMQRAILLRPVTSQADVHIHTYTQKVKVTQELILQSKDKLDSAHNQISRNLGLMEAGNAKTKEMNPSEIPKSYQNWKVRHPNIYVAEKLIDCSTPDATAKVRSAVETIQRYVHGHWRGPQPKDTDLEEALNSLKEAVLLDPECDSARLNWAILFTVLYRDSRAEHNFDSPSKVFTALSAKRSPIQGKAFLWLGIIAEMTFARHEFFHQARKATPSLSLDYFGIIPTDTQSPLKLLSYPSASQGLNGTAYDVLKSTVVHLLLWREYADFGIGYPSVYQTEAVFFYQNAITALPYMIDGPALQVIQNAYRYIIENKFLKLGDGQAQRYAIHNDILSRFISAQFVHAISRISSEKVKSSYTYFTGYVGGADLKPHLDRAQCRFTLTLQIDMDPVSAVWPFGVDARTLGEGTEPRTPPNNGRIEYPPEEHTMYLHLHPGDGGLIRGTRIIHFRNKLPEMRRSYNLFLHYVEETFDERLS